jgi:hypothetical protein
MTTAPLASAVTSPASTFDVNSTLPPRMTSTTGQYAGQCNGTDPTGMPAESQNASTAYVFPPYVVPSAVSPIPLPPVTPGYVFPPDIIPSGVSLLSAPPGTRGEVAGVTTYNHDTENRTLELSHNGLPSPFSQFSERATILSQTQPPHAPNQPTLPTTGVGIPGASNAKGAIRTAVRTADNLALLEANKFKVSGKRKHVPRTRA